MAHRVMRVWDSAWYEMRKDETLPIVSAIGTMVFILVLGYFLSYFMASENPSKSVSHPSVQGDESRVAEEENDDDE